jgi:hypothetical protein
VRQTQKVFREGFCLTFDRDRHRDSRPQPGGAAMFDAIDGPNPQPAFFFAVQNGEKA